MDLTANSNQNSNKLVLSIDIGLKNMAAVLLSMPIEIINNNNKKLTK